MYRLAIIFLALVLSTSMKNNAKPKPDKEITVAVASSLTLPLEEIARQFENKYHTRVQLSFASSGVLTAQIIQGAPFDVFISANMTYPQKLDSLGKTAVSTQIFTLGLLVFWSKTAFKKSSPAEFLSKNDIQTLSIANPDLAPFGAIAVKWLKKEKLYQDMHSKLVYGENIASVNQFIASGSVDAALTSVSALHTPQLHNKGYWEVLPASEIYGIPHCAVVIKQKRSRYQAKQFLEFLFSEKAQAILVKYGYMKPKKER